MSLFEYFCTLDEEIIVRVYDTTQHNKLLSANYGLATNDELPLSADDRKVVSTHVHNNNTLYVYIK